MSPVREGKTGEMKVTGRVSSAPPDTRSSLRPSSLPADSKGVARPKGSSDPKAAKGFEVYADYSKSILRLRVWGFWDIEDGKAYWEEFKRVAESLVGKKWYVLADISQFPAQRPDVNAFVEKTMVFARSHGMVRASNLVSSALSRMQIARLSGETGLPAYTFFQSEEEAIRWLLEG